jgi:hypothetical protein
MRRPRPPRGCCGMEIIIIIIIRLSELGVKSAGSVAKRGKGRETKFSRIYDVKCQSRIPRYKHKVIKIVIKETK